MAAADYRLCDVCSGKVFYDSNLNYDFDNRNERGEPALDYLGDWAVICTDCAKTHECKVVPLAPADSAAERDAALGMAKTFARAIVSEQDGAMCSSCVFCGGTEDGCPSHTDDCVYTQAHDFLTSSQLPAALHTNTGEKT